MSIDTGQLRADHVGTTRWNPFTSDHDRDVCAACWDPWPCVWVEVANQLDDVGTQLCELQRALGRVRVAMTGW